MSFKWWVLVAVFLFGVGLVLGLATPEGIAALIVKEFISFDEVDSGLFPSNFLTLILIWVKNAISLLVSFTFSPIFCLVPILALTVNGWLITFVSTAVVQKESLGFVLAGLLPHGIIEISAFILGEAAALSFGAMLILALFRKDKRSQLMPNFRKNVKYLMLALVLLVPAAIIETYITPLLIT